MTGISQIAEGDSEERPEGYVPPMSRDELHPEDAEMMFWYEQDEPAGSPHLIDPAVRAAANQARKRLQTGVQAG